MPRGGVGVPRFTTNLPVLSFSTHLVADGRLMPCGVVSDAAVPGDMDAAVCLAGTGVAASVLAWSSPALRQIVFAGETCSVLTLASIVASRRCAN